MPGAVAIVRDVSPALAACELTHLPRVPIDVAAAGRQHAAYVAAIEAAGYGIERLPADPALPDCVFVEDIAVVFDTFAIVTRPGAASRRPETPAVAAALGRHRELLAIEAPATLDGGDVLAVGRDVFVGVSSRSDAGAVAQLRALLTPRGHTVTPVAVTGCLHLKSAVTALGDGALLANPAWIDMAPFGAYEVLTVDPREPSAANVLRLRDRLLFPAAFPETAERLARRGHTIATVDVSELAKAEGAVTCCSLIVEP
jgi:dimethylargininase